MQYNETECNVWTQLTRTSFQPTEWWTMGFHLVNILQQCGLKQLDNGRFIPGRNPWVITFPTGVSPWDFYFRVGSIPGRVWFKLIRSRLTPLGAIALAAPDHDFKGGPSFWWKVLWIRDSNSNIAEHCHMICVYIYICIYMYIYIYVYICIYIYV